MPLRRTWKKIKDWFVHLLHLDDSAHRIALGVAIGMFVAMTPTWGLQMVLTVAISWLVGANKVAGVPCAWITNPLTGVPIYSLCYAVGHLLMGGPGLGTFRNLLRTSLDPNNSWGMLAAEWWHAMLSVALPLWVGCVVVGAAAGAISYMVIYYLISFYRRHHHRRPAGAEPTSDQAGSAGTAPP